MARSPTASERSCENISGIEISQFLPRPFWIGDHDMLPVL